jgi:hypothetical protein
VLKFFSWYKILSKLKKEAEKVKFSKNLLEVLNEEEKQNLRVVIRERV